MATAASDRIMERTAILAHKFLIKLIRESLLTKDTTRLEEYIHCTVKNFDLLEDDNPLKPKIIEIIRGERSRF